MEQDLDEMNIEIIRNTLYKVCIIKHSILFENHFVYKNDPDLWDYKPFYKSKKEIILCLTKL